MRDISISWEDGSTITNADAVIQQYEIALFTSSGEFWAEPNFGMGLEDYIAEPNNDALAKAIRAMITAKTATQFPELRITGMQVLRNSFNTVSIGIDVIIVPYGERRLIQKDLEL